ncbi:MAG: hypothetical protein ACYTDU_00135 [Planctomycetota bacterium]|jgi:hypothetical protein
MRVLLLCTAAFVVGLLAGALFWPRGEAAWERVRTPRESAPAVAPREREPVDRRGGPGDADVGALAHEAEAAIERFVPRDDDPAASGTITGSVRGPAGEPVAGAIVSAFPNSQPLGISMARRSRMRERRHEDVGLRDAAHDAILRELWRRRSRCVATTGADGRYELRVLGKTSHSLHAFHERYDVQPVARARECAPGSVVDFRAQPVVSVRVDVRMPDGALAETAWLQWRGRHGSGWVVWGPELNQVRLPLGKCSVKAQAWAPDPLQSAEVERTLGPQAAGTVLVLQLHNRRVLTARLVPPEGFALPDSVEFRLRRLVGSEQPDPAFLEKDQGPQTSSPSPGRCSWYDLASGRYLVAAFLDRSRLLAHAVAELGDGPTDVDLQVPDPTVGRHVLVTLRGPDGGRAVGQPWFRIATRSGARQRHFWPFKLPREDGSWALLLTDTPLQGVEETTLRVGTAEYGSVERHIDPASPGLITVRFENPARVRLRVRGYADSGLAGRLTAGLAGERVFLLQRPITPDGTSELAWVQPGEYGLQLILKQQSERWPIAQRRVALEAGDHEHAMAVPVLQTLRVRPAGRLRGQPVKLRCTDPAVGSFSRDGRPSGGVAVFEELGPGFYEIECRDKRLAVRVPGPAEVTIE